METVTQINSINGNAIPRTSRQQSVSPAAGFQDSLENALVQKSTGSTQNGQTAALVEPQSLGNPPISSSPSEIASRTDSLLDLLDSYADGLENPDTTLKDLSSLVDRIRDDAQLLMTTADNDTSAGSQLKDIAAQTALTANIEYFKFQRGDYL